MSIADFQSSSEDIQSFDIFGSDIFGVYSNKIKHFFICHLSQFCHQSIIARIDGVYSYEFINGFTELKIEILLCLSEVLVS